MENPKQVQQNRSEQEKHQAKMANKKRVVDERIAKAQEERGVLILSKGKGKGKSSSGFGMLARALGHQQRCAVIQFIKGRRSTGEQMFFSSLDAVDYHIMGQGFTWETQDKQQDIAAAEKAWKIAEGYLKDERYHFVLLDEFSYMFKYQYLAIDPVIQALKQRPKHQNVMITGRTMASELETIADTISIIHDERHAFRLGVKAQAGIEF